MFLLHPNFNYREVKTPYFYHTLAIPLCSPYVLVKSFEVYMSIVYITIKLSELRSEWKGYFSLRDTEKEEKEKKIYLKFENRNGE